jgi:hypothetical protein
MTTGRPNPAYIAQYSVRQYAMITFIDASAANKALNLNGSRLQIGDESTELVVCHLTLISEYNSNCNLGHT